SGAKVVSGNGLRKAVAEEAADVASYQHDRAKIDDAKRHIGRTLLYLLLLGLGPALVVVLVVWLVFGRERRTGYDRDYEQEPPTSVCWGSGSPCSSSSRSSCSRSRSPAGARARRAGTTWSSPRSAAARSRTRRCSSGPRHASGSGVADRSAARRRPSAGMRSA